MQAVSVFSELELKMSLPYATDDSSHRPSIQGQSQYQFPSQSGMVGMVLPVHRNHQPPFDGLGDDQSALPDVF